MHYTAYGLQIISELQLPELLHSPTAHPDVCVQYGSVPAALDNPVWQDSHCQAKPGQFLLTLEGIANFLVSEGNLIIIEPAQRAGRRKSASSC